MITSKELHHAACETNITTLRHQLSQFIDVCESELTDAFRNGVDGNLKIHLAYQLGLKKYVPEGWHPVKKQRKAKTKQMPKDIVGRGYPSGEKHYRYIDGRGKKEYAAKRGSHKSGKEHHLYGKNSFAEHNEKKKVYNPVITRHQTSDVKRIIYDCGGDKAVSLITGVSQFTVKDWPFLKQDNVQGFIPKRHIGKLSKFARVYGVNITRKELESLLP